MILVDGKRIDHVPVNDRGLAYGDGLFETLRARGARLPLLDRHLERLEHGLGVLGIAPPPREILIAELDGIAREFPDGIVKLTVTRGSGGRGYRPAASAPRRIVQGFEAPAWVEPWQRNGVRVRICETRLEGPGRLAGLKHLNRLAQVLARAEWRDEFEEGLMRDAAGKLVEGTMSNLFIARDNRLVTPPAGAGVRGVMRQFVMELAGKMEYAVQEAALDDAEILAADEKFLTNSVIGVVPVRRLGSRACPVGTMTRRLQAAVEKQLDERACFED